LLSFALIMGIFTGLNGFYVSTSRLLFAMGRAKILPKAFGKLHPKYKTPHIGILFTLAFTLFAPFFGHEALLWVVDMSALGVTIAYFYAFFVAYRLFTWSEDATKNAEKVLIVAPGRKIFSLLGTITSIAFFLLLVVPGSPGFLGAPSWNPGDPGTTSRRKKAILVIVPRDRKSTRLNSSHVSISSA